jgi:hypothetical protein
MSKQGRNKEDRNHGTRATATTKRRKKTEYTETKRRRK